MSDWLPRLAGRFIVFDGPDGSGKSTQLARFAGCCRVAGVPLCEVREPGGTPVGEHVRAILLNPAHGEMGIGCEMLLYMASRAQLVEQVIRPALSRRELVLADRFISSTLAYQGTAGGLTREEILAVGRIAVGDCWPDLTVIFDVNESVAAQRLSRERDRMERKDAAFHRLVRDGYLAQAAAQPDRHLVIEAGASSDAVFERLLEAVQSRFKR